MIYCAEVITLLQKNDITDTTLSEQKRMYYTTLQMKKIIANKRANILDIRIGKISQKNLKKYHNLNKRLSKSIT